MKAINPITLVKVFFRSFLVQAAWNYEGMQNAGFIYGIMPAVRKIYPDKARRIEAIKSHLEFFNTHPYMAGVMMGMTIALEEKIAADGDAQSASREMIQVSKNNMACPLAAIGDTFFWAVWRPFCALVIVLPAVLLQHSVLKHAVIQNSILNHAVFHRRIPNVPHIFSWFFFFGFLIVFNSLNIAMRCYGVFRGYQLKEKIVMEISRLNVQKFISIFRMAGFVTVCLGTFLYFIMDLRGAQEKIMALFVFITGAYLYRKGVSSTKLFFGLLVFFIAVCLVGI